VLLPKSIERAEFTNVDVVSHCPLPLQWLAFARMIARQPTVRGSAAILIYTLVLPLPPKLVRS
jgi:hypothetical protein